MRISQRCSLKPRKYEWDQHKTCILSERQYVSWSRMQRPLWTAVNKEPRCIIWACYVMQFYVQTLSHVAERATGQRRLSCGKVKAKSGGCIIKTGSKRYCTKEGCSSNAFIYSTNFKPGGEVYSTSGLSSSVYLQGYMTWLCYYRSDVSSCFFFFFWPASSHRSSYSRVPSVTKNCLC